MFVPGDPIEQRKRALIAKMAGARGKGGAGGGFRVGRPSGAGFGRGMGFGAAGGQGNRALALPQLLGGYGGAGPGGNSGFGSGVDTSVQNAPQFTMDQDQMSMPGTETYSGPTISSFSGSTSLQPAISPQILKQLLGGYGQAPAPQQQMWGSGNNRYY